MQDLPPLWAIDAVIADPQSVESALASRASVRAYQNRPVAREAIEWVLNMANRAPSGTNTQPWKVYVLQGARKAEVVNAACAEHDAFRDGKTPPPSDYDYYPSTWVSPYIDRRRDNGWGLYGVLGIAKGQKEAMHAQHQQNFRFFDAPVGMIFTLDKVMGRGSLVDYGMYLQSLMVAARALGLHTCPQAAWVDMAHVVKPLIGAGENELLVCGLALGYADLEARVNAYRSPRQEIAAYTQWLE